LTVDQWFEVSFAIEDREAAQVKHSYYIMNMYAQNAGYTMAKKLEVALTSLFSGFSGIAGSSVLAVADSDILSAISQLESNGVDTTQDVAFFFSPGVFWKQLQAINKFSLAINAPINDPVGKRPAALLYGKTYAVVKSFLIKSGNSFKALYKLVFSANIPVYATI
jgi:hypothetical protein